MEKTTSTGWKSIVEAPADVDLELSFYDKGNYYVLAFPCQRDGSQWRDVRANRSLRIKPTHWRIWTHKSE